MWFSKGLVALVALIHFYLMVVEIFAWTTRGKEFLSGLDPKTFEPSVILAMNVGVYNGFLAAGLVWSLLISDPVWKTKIALFFLAFISFAGVFGAVTADWKLLLVQSVPALLAIAAIHCKGRASD